MSQLNTTPVIRCKLCNKLLVVRHLSTTTADPHGEELMQLFKSLAANALCEDHQNAFNYYASIGKGQEFLEGKTV